MRVYVESGSLAAALLFLAVGGACHFGKKCAPFSCCPWPDATPSLALPSDLWTCFAQIPDPAQQGQNGLDLFGRAVQGLRRRLGREPGVGRHCVMSCPCVCACARLNGKCVCLLDLRCGMHFWSPVDRAGRAVFVTQHRSGAVIMDRSRPPGPTGS